MRLPDWQSKFAATIKKYQASSFSFGSVDCGLFCADCILAITGKNIVPPAFRGTYETMADGFRLIKEYSGGGMEAIAEKLAAANGFVEIAPAFAQRGDVGLYRDPKHGDVLGVSLGAEFAFLTQTAGLCYRRCSALARVWRVG